MKKLIIIAAVIVAGVAANAASFKWTAANIYGSDGTTKYSGSATLYAYLSTATADDAIVAYTATVTSGAINATAGTFSNDSLVGGNTYSFFFVVENDAGAKFTSQTVSATAQATTTSNITFGNMASATQASGAWVAVPEPTSGLLMLLGMAGLALRRRRA